MASVVVRVGVALEEVQVVPPSQERSTHMVGVLLIESTKASNCTLMPWMVDPAGMLIP